MKPSAFQEPKAAAQPAVFELPDESLTLVAKVQERLTSLGFLPPGHADGVEGAMTRDAVRSYQSRNNLGSNGDITPALLAHMEAGFQEIGANP